jgi:release factor glutamine methyltransferase
VSTPETLGSLHQRSTDELAAANIEQPRLEARMLLAHAAGIDRTRIFGYPEDVVEAATVKSLQDMIARRKTGEPIAYITGIREFWSLDFKVNRDTLIPRPDSETLIEAVLENTPDKNAKLKILDLGTGSGCLVLALLSELPNAQGIGLDINPGACKTATENATNLGLADRITFSEGNWMDGIQGKFDIIMSNPPYILESDIVILDRDVKAFEPHLALSGGPDGLAAYRLIAAQSGPHLTPHGILAVEMGQRQVIDIKQILSKNDFEILKIYQDIANIERCILATVKNS